MPKTRLIAYLFSFLCLLATAPALFSQHLDLTAGTGSVQIGDLDVPGNAITVEALIYLDKNTMGGNIVSKHVTVTDVNYLLRPLTFELTTYLNGSSGPTHFIQLFNPRKLTLNKWYHVAGTYDGKRVKYYVNGCLVADTAFSGDLVQNNYTAAIGNRSSCNCEQFSGKIDELRIWKIARNQPQIAANMLTLPNAGKEAGLLAWYTFKGNYENSQGNKLWNGIATGNAVLSPGGANVQQAFEITGLQSADADCEKTSNGNITIQCNKTDVVYSLDNVKYQASGLFTAMKTGHYIVYARDAEGCVMQTEATVGNHHNLVPLDLSFTLCKGNGYGGHTTAGIYLDTLPASSGCDTLRKLTLTDLRVVIREEQILCEGKSYLGHQSAGVFADTLVSANGCDSIRVLTLKIVSPPKPDLGADRLLCRGDTVHLSPGQFDSYKWQDGSSANQFNVSGGGLYSVRVTNACGTGQQQVHITEGVCGLFFPGAFTPNGDGMNDVFRPAVYNLQNVQWRIFNRFGQLIFETKDPYKGWDGRIKGQLQSPGVFVWSCTYNSNMGTQLKKGTVVLIR